MKRNSNIFFFFSLRKKKNYASNKKVLQQYFERRILSFMLKGCGMGPWLVLVSPCFRENVEKVYFRSQILERPSIGEYWNIFGVPVLPENVIFTFFRTCWSYLEAYNTGMQKWSSIVQYSCTSIWDLKYTFSENVVVTYKIGSFLCSIVNLLQKNVIVFFFGNQISKWGSFEN